MGVCPGGVADGILWSSTPEEANDLKLCPFPQLGEIEFALTSFTPQKNKGKNGGLLE